MIQIQKSDEIQLKKIEIFKRIHFSFHSVNNDEFLYLNHFERLFSKILLVFKFKR